MVKFIKKILYSVISKYFPHTLLIEGVLRGTEYPFRCLLVANSSYFEYLKARTFSDSPTVIRKSRIWIPLLRKRILTNADSFDLCIAVLPMASEPTYRGLYEYKCTKYVNQTIDTTGSLDEIKSKFSKQLRNKINKLQKNYRLDYRISNSLKDFDHFYHRMHVPFIKKRHGDLALIYSYNKLKNSFLKGGLLFVMKDNVEVAGSLFKIEDKTCVGYRLGVLDGDESHIDVLKAIYYYQIKVAKENGMSSVDLKGSEPFLNDGVYQHKRQWGPTVLPRYEENSWVYFFNAKPSEKLAKFFEINPLIADTDQGLIGIIGIADEADVFAETIDKLTRQNRARGIQGFTMITQTKTLNVLDKSW